MALDPPIAQNISLEILSAMKSLFDFALSSTTLTLDNEGIENLIDFISTPMDAIPDMEYIPITQDKDIQDLSPQYGPEPDPKPCPHKDKAKLRKVLLFVKWFHQQNPTSSDWSSLTTDQYDSFCLTELTKDGITRASTPVVPPSSPTSPTTPSTTTIAATPAVDRF